jgi:hypothetical protein
MEMGEKSLPCSTGPIDCTGAAAIAATGAAMAAEATIAAIIAPRRD